MELDYVNADGNHVKTSAAHRKRGRCCSSSCLHCPYGHTLKKFGLKFIELDSDNTGLAQEISQSKIDLEHYSLKDYRFFTLKGVVAGVMRKDKLFVREIFYAKHFEDQGLTKEIIESYFFY
jgi:hypothetical protein